MRKTGFLIYLLAMLFAIVVITVRFTDGFPLETNILALLPESEEAEWIQRAEAAHQARGADQLVILVGHPDFEVAHDASLKFKKALELSDIIEIKGDTAAASGFAALSKTLFPFRTGLLSDLDRQRLARGDGKQLTERALAQILSPVSIADADLIRDDPLLLFPNFLGAQLGASPLLQSKDGVLAVDDAGKWYVLVTGSLTGAPFDRTFQAQARNAFDKEEAALRAQYGDIEIFKTGAIFYGEEAYRQAENEASFIGGISLIGIILLNIFVFRSVQPLLFSLLAIASGITGGLAVTLLFFGKLHLLALVFGAGLIGIAVDYAFHYFCERFQPKETPPAARAKAIRSGLTLGLVSSVLGFLTLSLTPFPGLQQIALFSASGLTLAYLCVLFVFPLIDRGKSFSHGEAALTRSMLLYRFWWQGKFKPVRWLVIVSLLVVGGFGAFRITVDDDVRRLQSLPAGLQTEEQTIRGLTGIDNETHRILIRGTSSDDVLEHEETLRFELDRLIREEHLGGYQAISEIIPSKARQLENRELVQRQMAPHLDGHMKSLGLSGPSPYVDSNDVVSVEYFDGENGFGPLDRLRAYSVPGVVVHLISLSGVRDSDKLTALVDRSENIALVNQAEGLSDTFGVYRLRSLVMLAIAYGVVWVFLSLRYGLISSIRVMIPSLGAVILAPCILALFGQPFTFFNAMSLMLVFAIGLDYALFNREAAGERKSRAMLANGLSAISTILAFGLLSLSETFAIHAFGITILIGIVLAYVLAPIAADINQKTPEAL